MNLINGLLSVILSSTICLLACVEEDTTCRAVTNQVSTNVGTSNGGNCWTASGLASSNYWLCFNNINLTVSPSGTHGGNGSQIVDIGNKCLAKATTWPGGGTTGSIAVEIGHTYIIQWADGVYQRFTVNSYSGGIMNYTYVTGL